MTTLDEWAVAVAAKLGISEIDERETGIVLNLARDVAHGVMRPAAPLTSYLLGIAIGRGADPATAAATVTDMARAWEAST